VATSQKKSVLSQIESDDIIPAGTMAYLCERARNNFFDYVLAKFRLAEANGLTKAKLARRIGKTPDRVSHLLGSPGNWTIDTGAELLVGICREELIPASEPFIGRKPKNYLPSDEFTSREPPCATPGTRAAPEMLAVVELI
jgi:hypothetical protein